MHTDLFLKSDGQLMVWNMDTKQMMFNQPFSAKVSSWHLNDSLCMYGIVLTLLLWDELDLLCCFCTFWAWIHYSWYSACQEMELWSIQRDGRDSSFWCVNEDFWFTHDMEWMHLQVKLEGVSGVLGNVTNEIFIDIVPGSGSTPCTYLLVTENGLLASFNEFLVLDKWVDAKVYPLFPLLTLFVFSHSSHYW